VREEPYRIGLSGYDESLLSLRLITL